MFANVLGNLGSIEPIRFTIEPRFPRTFANIK